MKARFHPCDWKRETKGATLTETTHPKGGEAWDVTIDGVSVGVLRRWEREEIRTATTPNTARIWKTTVTLWTAYAPGKEGRVFTSRDRAICHLWTATSSPTVAPPVEARVSGVVSEPDLQQGPLERSEAAGGVDNGEPALAGELGQANLGGGR